MVLPAGPAAVVRRFLDCDQSVDFARCRAILADLCLGLPNSESICSFDLCGAAAAAGMDHVRVGSDSSSIAHVSTGCRHDPGWTAFCRWRPDCPPCIDAAVFRSGYARPPVRIAVVCTAGWLYLAGNCAPRPELARLDGGVWRGRAAAPSDAA